MPVFSLVGFGIRLNKKKPNLYFRKKDKGGVNFNSMIQNPTHLDADIAKTILHEYKIHNADVTLREDSTVDDLIDCIEGNRFSPCLITRAYIPCLYVLNKIDGITMEELEIINKFPHYVPISGHLEWNLDGYLEKMWEYLDLTRM